MSDSAQYLGWRVEQSLAAGTISKNAGHAIRASSRPPSGRRARTRRTLQISALIVAFLQCRPVLTSELAPAKQAIFLARVIAYDANLKKRVGQTVNIAVLARKGDRDSEKMAGLLEKAFIPLERATILGLPMRISRLDYVGRESLDRAVREGGIDTIYVCSGLNASLADIKSVARARKVLTMASQEAHLKLGLSIGVFDIQGRNTIIVNLEANREEGVAFPPELLRLATVVR